MNESVNEIQRLLREAADHLKTGTSTDTRKAAAKLERIAALASTLALTVKTALSRRAAFDGSVREVIEGQGKRPVSPRAA